MLGQENKSQADQRIQQNSDLIMSFREQEDEAQACEGPQQNG